MHNDAFRILVVLSTSPDHCLRCQRRWDGDLVATRKLHKPISAKARQLNLAATYEVEHEQEYTPQIPGIWGSSVKG